MKNLNRTLTIATAVLCSFVLSCKEGDVARLGDERIVQETEKLVISELRNSKFSAELKDVFSSKREMIQLVTKEMGMEVLNLEDFDFSVLHRTRIKESDVETFTVASRENPNIAFTASKFNGHLLNPIIIKTENAGRETLDASIEYVDFSNLITLKISKKNDHLAFSHKNFGTRIDRNAKLSVCGQASMDCISDAYTNHGWASIFVTVASAFQPAVAGGIASACIGKNCGHHW